MNVSIIFFGSLTLAWWILGLVWRFNEVGQFSCGDITPEGTTKEVWLQTVQAPGSLYQFKSEKFMKLYYIISLSII